jgi:TonB family protein
MATALFAFLLTACSTQTAKPHAFTFAPATPACNADATVAVQAQPEFPDEVRGKVHEAQVSISVDIAASGKLHRAVVEQSSGFPALDTAALTAALHSTYSPARRNCKNVPGTYDFKVTFSAND